MDRQLRNERCILLAEYLIERNSTVRQAAAHFSISKSTVHKDISVRLQEIDTSLYERAKRVMDQNKSERHIRGGEATRRKYLKKRSHASDCENATNEGSAACRRPKS